MKVIKEIQFESVLCYRCGGMFYLTSEWTQRRIQDGKCFYCPYCGCSLSFTDSENKKLRDQLARERAEHDQREAWLREQKNAAIASRDFTKRKLRAAKGQRTKLIKRISQGKCPCCSKSFSDLRTHMQERHPGFKVSRPSKKKVRA